MAEVMVDEYGRPEPHMIEEDARHNGHADLMRESIDGQTGD
jgi:Protein of unknown function (DUF664)